MILNYLGKTIDSVSVTKELEKDKIEFIKKNYYNENKDLALDQLKKILNENKYSMNHIYNYYFERLASDTVLYNAKWSINEMLNSDDLIQLFINRTYRNPKMYNKDLMTNFKTSIRLGGKGIVRKPSNFPLKECVRLIEKYALNSDKKIYVDTSCGWGVRMLASAILGINYVGFDVNEPLIEKLNEFGNDIKSIKPSWDFKIFNSGSQYLKQSCIDRADIMLTSPPYFNLEVYGDNTYDKEDTINQSYDNWLELFLKPTLENSYKYIKANGYVLINIKSFDDYDLVKDTIETAKQVGFEHVGFDVLKNIKRPLTDTSKNNDNSEDVIVFRKVV